MQKFIVAELTKNWTAREPVSQLISQQFEAAINTNFQRGYKLVDWRIVTAVADGIMTETIIAIFQQIDES